MNDNLKKVITFGCRLNNLESELINKQLENNSIKNVFVFNTCSVTAEAERKARQSIRKLKKENPKCRIIVTGCAAQINPEKWLQMSEVSQVIGNFEKTNDEFWLNSSITHESRVKEPLNVSDIMNIKSETADYSGLLNQKSRYFLQIQNGCDHRCTFCIIPYGRGNSRSIDVDTILKNIGEAIEKKFQEVVLTGVDLTSWGKDFTHNQLRLGNLVRKILDEFKDLKRLRVSSIDPAEIDFDFMDVLEKDKRLMPHLHLSIQHGDDIILKRMKRRHLSRDVINLVMEAKRRRPDIVFGADIIAGFPTETLKAHQNTLKLIKEADIKFVHVFPFSPRKGTPAANMKMLPKDVISKRAREIRLLGNYNRFNYYNSLIKTKQKVLVEAGNKGYTECFSKVEFNKKIQPGIIVEATVVSSTKNALKGTLL